MMNAELVVPGKECFVAPTICRANYISALKAISLSGRPEPLIRMLDCAPRWTVAVDRSSGEDTRRAAEACNAIADLAVAEEQGCRLLMPRRPLHDWRSRAACAPGD